MMWNKIGSRFCLALNVNDGAPIAKAARLLQENPRKNAKATRAPPRMLQSLSQATELKAKRKEIAQNFLFLKEMLKLIDHPAQSAYITELS